MRWRRPARTRSSHTLRITLLILSLVHTPLPQPDFHNIRHHDGSGEVCEYHDHLLRWHPGAGVASDVAVLHWHWFLPSEPGAEMPEGSGAAIHAHVPTSPAPLVDTAPQIVPDPTSRLVAREIPCPFDLPLTLPVIGALPVSGMPPTIVFSATFARQVSLTSLLHRWVC